MSIAGPRRRSVQIGGFDRQERRARRASLLGRVAATLLPELVGLLLALVTVGLGWQLHQASPSVQIGSTGSVTAQPQLLPASRVTLPGRLWWPGTSSRKFAGDWFRPGPPGSTLKCPPTCQARFQPASGSGVSLWSCSLAALPASSPRSRPVAWCATESAQQAEAAGLPSVATGNQR
ncbi:MAG TPA: hypothetical protein VMD59_24500 [Acidimicrobiales bacterium]|nr:hypothetical protein [Acidimicrobiales bacterium]